MLADTMIAKRTVLVLGAGASAPYGYPLGQRLVDILVGYAGVQRSPGFRILLNARFNENEIMAFVLALAGSGRQSVDAFLESRTDFQNIGRHAIAAELLHFDRVARPQLRKGWYPYLYNEMCLPSVFESFGTNQLTIVTFNYDMSLEVFLFEALQNGFQKKGEECAENLKTIPIIYVHGQLDISPAEGVTPYGGEVTPERVKSAASKIKIIYEADHNTQEFQDARRCLKESERICFLGFGYHPVNLRRLMEGTSLAGKIVYCCGKDLTPAETRSKGRLLEQYGADLITWGKKDDGCLEFLRETGALLG